VPVLDIRQITDELAKAKQLIQSVMEELRLQREPNGPAGPALPLI
jgi:hypothetical protein